MSNGKYNGMKRASDWDGKAVVLVRDIRNSYLKLPAGYKGTVRVLTRGWLTFEGEPCKCCGVTPRVTRVGYDDVAVAS